MSSHCFSISNYIVVNVFFQAEKNKYFFMIQSVNNKKIKEYAKLIQKKERDKTNLFLVEGEHMVKEAFNAKALQELFILEGLECPIEFNYETVTQQVLNKLSNQNSNSKMIGVCKKLNLKPKKENSIL